MSKVLEELSMWNCDLSKFGLSGGCEVIILRTNALDVALLRALAYKVKVEASKYVKYYFLLCEMLFRGGLAMKI